MMCSHLVHVGSRTDVALEFPKAVKRLMREYAELSQNPDPDYTAAPVGDNLFEWHFTITGPDDSAFEGGRYHGRILLPDQYPFKPPDIPSGRFAVNQKICLSITGYHPQSWQPSWGIRTTLIALRAFLPTKAKGAIGGLDCSAAERRKLAAASHDWTCSVCKQSNVTILPIVQKETGDVVREEKEDDPNTQAKIWQQEWETEERAEEKRKEERQQQQQQPRQRNRRPAMDTYLIVCLFVIILAILCRKMVRNFPLDFISQ